MISVPPRKRLPALCLVVVGLLFCTIAVTGATDPSGPYTYSVFDAGNSCENSPTEAYEFDDLSPRGRAFFAETLESEYRETTIKRATPPEFSVVAGDVAPSDQGRGDPELGQYIYKDDKLYRLTIMGPGPLGGAVDGFLLFVSRIVGGVALAIVGAGSYMKSNVIIPSVLLTGSAIFVISPLLWLIGLLRWSMWMQRIPQLKIAVIILFFTTMMGIIYDGFYSPSRRDSS